jgi:two-component system cell cycle response regulator DivK
MHCTDPMRARGLILLVDDDPDTWYVYSRVLWHAGYQVLEAHDGAEGLAVARDSLPDLIFMDYRMPVMNGWEAVRALKADPRTAHIPVLSMTAYDMGDAGAAAFAAGCDEFLDKPTDPFAVVAAAARWIGRPVGDEAERAGTERGE